MEIILPLHYFPNIAYFSYLKRSAKVFLDPQEHYQKGTFRNSTTILGPNGAQNLIIPIRKSAKSLIGAKEIAYDMPWHMQHIKSIRTAYSSAPYYEYYSEVIFDLLREQESSLWKLNMQILNQCVSWLKLPTKLTALTDESMQIMMEQNIPLVRPLLSLKYTEEVHHLTKNYPQIFEYKFGFVDNLSIIDLLMCCGPSAAQYI